MTLVLLGPPLQINHLAGSVLGYEDLLKSENPQLSTAAASMEESISWRIDNKYYHAEVSIRFVPTDAGLPSELGAFDGLVVVASSREEFPAEVSALLEGGEDKLRLVVQFTEGDDGGEDSGFFSLFAVDHGCEYIEINKAALTKDHSSRDKFGLPRLIEALQSHMWSSMRRKGPAASSGPVGAQPLADVEEEDDEDDRVPVSLPSPPGQEPSDLPPNPFPSADENDFVGMEDFVKTMMQARSMREQVDKGALNDEDRREQAAQFAMRLMEMLHLEEEEDS